MPYALVNAGNAKTSTKYFKFSQIASVFLSEQYSFIRVVYRCRYKLKSKPINKFFLRHVL